MIEPPQYPFLDNSVSDTITSPLESVKGTVNIQVTEQLTLFNVLKKGELQFQCLDGTEAFAAYCDYCDNPHWTVWLLEGEKS